MPLRGRVQNVRRSIKEFLYGAFYHQLYLDSVKTAASYKDFFLFMLYGELLGVPLLSNYYTLRTLPYILDEVYDWKLRMLKEKDFTDATPGAEMG